MTDTTAVPVMTADQVIEQARRMPAAEIKRLMHALLDLMPTPETPPARGRSILELRGMGKHVWENIDVQEYLDQLRSEWDERR
jgi:hypothetical protein